MYSCGLWRINACFNKFLSGVLYSGITIETGGFDGNPTDVPNYMHDEVN